MSSYFSERQTRSMKTLSIQRPRPSIEMRTPASMSAPVKAAAVNWLTIGVENLRLAVSGQCFFQRSEAERGVHRVGEPPGENGPARPVDDRDQIEEAPADRDVRYIGRPDLVRPLDRHVAQEIGINLVPRRGLARPRLRPERLDPHQPHQPPHALAVDRETLLRQRPCDAPGAEERPGGEQRVDAPHRLKATPKNRSRFAIDARARHAEHRALSAYR